MNPAQQDNKFVTSQPADSIGFAHPGLHTLGYDLEQLVANLMAKRIVDRLEAVKVNKLRAPDSCRVKRQFES
ncbi:hypothetical protein SAMN05216411_1044 [Nitrosospira multiformis]|nr:hypothetical protein SAMN05216411_1044 [Nitrosospira multiformis]